jgi:hypothetical protein
LFVLVVLGATAARAAGSQRLAVLGFEQPDPSVDRKYFSDRVRGTLSDRVPGIFVMTRENILELLGGADAGDCEGQCEVETGRKIGADYVVSGRFTKVGSFHVLSLRLHAVGRGNLLASGEARGKSTDDLVEAVDLAAEKLSIPLLPEDEREARAADVEARMDERVARTGARGPVPAAAVASRPSRPVKRLPAAWGFVGAGAAAAAVGAGAVFGLGANSTRDEYLAGNHDRAKADQLQSQYRRQTATANILFAAGGALAIGTALYLVLR